MMALGKARRFRRIMTDRANFAIVAMDQRAILTNILAGLKGVAPGDLPFSDVLAVKRLLAQTLAPEASAMLFDPNIAIPAAIDDLPSDTGLIVSLEDHRVEETAGGRKTGTIPGWSVEKIQKLGADAVKVLIWYHPDADPAVCRHQQDYVRAVGAQCAARELPFVLELLLYDVSPTPDSAVQSAERRPELVLRSVTEFAKPDYCVDLFKLESPVPVDALEPLGEAADPAFRDVGAACAAADIPWALLSAGATAERFARVLGHAYAAGAHGFLAGRAIWQEPLKAFPDLAACRHALETEGLASLRLLSDQTRRSAATFQLPPHDFSAVRVEGDFALAY